MRQRRDFSAPAVATADSKTAVGGGDKAAVVGGGTRRLLRFRELPVWLQWNEYITDGYRCQLPVAACVRSVAQVHNESGNIHTHLAGFVLFAALAVRLAVSDADWVHKSILSVYLAAACCCMLLSAVYHTFLCHSPAVHHQVCMLDYTGISLLIIASFYPPIFYVFYCYSPWGSIYLGAISLFGISSITLSQFRFYHQNHGIWTWVRPLLWMATAGSGLVPAVHSMLIFPLHDAAPLYMLLLRMYLLYAVGMFFLISKFPERSFPGRFNLLGHSHQIWHLFVVAAAYTQYELCVGIHHQWVQLYAESGCPTAAA